MKIKIEDTNESRAAIKAALDKAHKTRREAQAHVFGPWDILCLSEEAEDMLDNLNLLKKERPGAVLIATSGHKLPSRYRYQRIASRVALVRGAKNWFLIEAEKTLKGPNESTTQRLGLSDAQKLAWLENTMKNLGIFTLNKKAEG